MCLAPTSGYEAGMAGTQRSVSGIPRGLARMMLSMPDGFERGTVTGIRGVRDHVGE